MPQVMYWLIFFIGSHKVLVASILFFPEVLLVSKSSDFSAVMLPLQEWADFCSHSALPSAISYWSSGQRGMYLYRKKYTFSFTDYLVMILFIIIFTTSGTNPIKLRAIESLELRSNDDERVWSIRFSTQAIS